MRVFSVNDLSCYCPSQNSPLLHPLLAPMATTAIGRWPNLVVCQSKALKHLFTRIRDVNTDAVRFAQYSRRILRIIAEEGVANLPATPVRITTPTQAEFDGELVDEDNIAAVSIIRAGDSLLDAFLQVVPSAVVGEFRDPFPVSCMIRGSFVAFSRQDSHPTRRRNCSAEALLQQTPCKHRNQASDSPRPHARHRRKRQLRHSSKPPILKHTTTLVIYSRVSSQVLLDHGVPASNILFLNVLACPEGLDALHNAYPGTATTTMSYMTYARV